MDSYPTHPQDFNTFLRRHHLCEPRVKTVEGVSASNWTVSHLYLLRVVIAETVLDEDSLIVPQEARHLLRDAEAHLNENTRLKTLLEAVRGKQHHFPPPKILKLLNQEGVREGISFFVSIRGLLEPKRHYTQVQHENDELVAVKAVLAFKPSKTSSRRHSLSKVNYSFRLREDGPNTRSQTMALTHRAQTSTDQGKQPKLAVQAAQNIAQPQMAKGAPGDQPQGEGISMISNDDHAEKERLKDELVTTGMVMIFVSLLFTLYYECIEENSEEVDGEISKYRAFTIAQKPYHVQTKFGDYNSKTDGGVYEVLFNGRKCWPVDPVTGANIVDMEAKAAGISEPLPQHIAELIAHIFARLKMFYNAREFRAYDDLSDAQRTVYLFCFHQTNFRVMWATFTPEYLEFLFGSPHDVFWNGDFTFLHSLTSDLPLPQSGNAEGLRRSNRTRPVNEQATSNQAAKSKSRQPRGTTKPIQQIYASQTLPIIFVATRKMAAIIILALGLLNQNHGDVTRNS